MFSIACHIVYLQNFSDTWPVIPLSAPSFIASCILVVADHFLWFFHFSRISHDARHQRAYRNALTPKVPGFAEIATFFGICVWLAPLFLFLSLSANDNALPMSSGNFPVFYLCLIITSLPIRRIRNPDLCVNKNLPDTHLPLPIDILRSFLQLRSSHPYKAFPKGYFRRNYRTPVTPHASPTALTDCRVRLRHALAWASRPKIRP